jgi:putative hydrolase of the HAD superfamily
MAIRAVIFDLGGVVLDSPMHAIADFEREHGIPEGFVNRVIGAAGPEGAWAQLERGLVRMAEFVPAFEAECANAGHPISATDLMQVMATGGPRPVMVEAIRRIRASGLLTAALTNNFPAEGPEHPMDDLRSQFDAFFESSVLGLHKPDPRIYEHACLTLSITASEAVFLDDIGRNLKAARALGMTTIKVDAPEPALCELAEVIGIDLGASR